MNEVGEKGLYRGIDHFGEGLIGHRKEGDRPVMSNLLSIAPSQDEVNEAC